MSYATVAELKAALDPNEKVSWTAADDENLRVAILAAETVINDVTGASWEASASVARYYTAEHGDLLFIDPALSITALETDDDGDGSYATSWAATDYKLHPLNAAADGEPYRWIEITPDGDYSFPTYQAAVKVTGTWGNRAEAPASIKLATLLIAQRLWKRHEAIFGVAGTTALGVERLAMKIATDPDIQQLLTTGEGRDWA